MADTDRIRSAIGELRNLTECRCDPAWTDRGLHHPQECVAEYREDVITLVDEITRLRSEVAEPRAADTVPRAPVEALLAAVDQYVQEHQRVVKKRAADVRRHLNGDT